MKPQHAAWTIPLGIFLGASLPLLKQNLAAFNTLPGWAMALIGAGIGGGIAVGNWLVSAPGQSQTQK